MKPKEFNILIFLCALILGLSACAEPSHAVSDNTVVETGDNTVTLAPTVALTDEPEEPVITIIPTVTPLPTEEPVPTITWVPTVTPIAALAVTPTSAPAHTSAPVEASTPTPPPAQTPADDSTFSVTYLDVGQGDAALISCDGHYMLVDGGDTGCSNQIYSYLKRNEISTLDILVASHAHVDHVGGLSGALNYAKAELVLCPVTEYDTDAFRDFVKYAGKNGPGITVPKKLSTYSLGSA